MIKAAIFDWNGTMCSDDLQVDSRVVAVWREIKAQGLFPFGPATGNNLDYCRELSRLVCDWDFCIAELGAVFYPSTNGRIHSADLERFKSLIGLDPANQRFCLGGYENEPKEVILTMCGGEKAPQWEEYFNKVISENGLSICVTRYSNGHIDIYPVEVSKKLGVEKVCRKYDIKPKEVLVFGDGLNDLGLFNGTIGVAVANADDLIQRLVKEMGGYQASFSHGLGVLQGLYHFAKLGAFRESEKVLQIVRKHFPEAPFQKPDL